MDSLDQMERSSTRWVIALVGLLTASAAYMAGRLSDDGCPDGSFCQNEDEWADVMFDGIEEQNAAAASESMTEVAIQSRADAILRAAQLNLDLERTKGALEECRRGQ